MSCLSETVHAIAALHKPIQERDTNRQIDIQAQRDRERETDERKYRKNRDRKCNRKWNIVRNKKKHTSAKASLRALHNQLHSDIYNYTCIIKIGFRLVDKIDGTSVKSKNRKQPNIMSRWEGIIRRWKRFLGNKCRKAPCRAPGRVTLHPKDFIWSSCFWGADISLRGIGRFHIKRNQLAAVSVWLFQIQ